MAELSEWGIAASDNNVTSPDGAQTGWVGADVGPWARETMAAIARWYGDPAWVNPMKNGLDPTGNKTITRSAGTQIQVVASSNWGSGTTAKFAAGRLVRFQQSTGTWHYAFITASAVSTTTLTLDLSLMGTATLTSGWAFNDNQLEFYSPLSETTTDKATEPISAMAFGGYGTTTERNTKFPSVVSAPAGIIWMNTTDSLIQVVTGTAGSRMWSSVAPLSSVWADAGGDLALESTGQSKITLDSATGNGSALVFQENGVDTSRIIYEAGGGNTVFEGGDTSATAGRIYIKDSDGKAYYRNYSGGVAGVEQSLTPRDLAGDMRFRTGAGSAGTITHTNHTLTHSGTLPAEMQEMFESDDYDEIELDIVAVIQCLFSGSPAATVNIGVNLWFGSGYDTTPPADLNSGYAARFVYYQNGENPYIAHYTQSTPYNSSFGVGSIRPAFRVPIYTSTLGSTVDSFAIAARREDGTSTLNYTWLANSGDIYSSFTVARALRLVT